MSLAFPKPRPRALEKADRQKRKQSVEARENAKVKARSGGRCEVVEKHQRALGPEGAAYIAKLRCWRRASEIHHMLGGSGRRGVGESAKAENKLHLCGVCHDLVTRHILQVHWTQVEDRAGTHYAVRLK